MHFDALDGAVFWRGIDNLDNLDSTLFSDYIGATRDGSGLYHGTGRTGIGYMNNGPDSWAYRARLARGARVYRFQDLALQPRFFTDSRYGMPDGGEFFENVGNQIAFMGHDAYVMENSNNPCYVVLNKRVLVGDGRTMPDGVWGERILGGDVEPMAEMWERAARDGDFDDLRYWNTRLRSVNHFTGQRLRVRLFRLLMLGLGEH